MSFLGFFGGHTKDTSVVFYQLSDQKESVDGCDAVSDKARDIFSLRASFPLDEGLVPQSAELRVVLLYLRGKLFLAVSELFKRLNTAHRLFNRKHEWMNLDNGQLMKEQADEKPHQGLLDPVLTEDEK